MQKYIFSVLITTLLCNYAHADIGRFDILEFYNGASTLYVKVSSNGVLQNSDLCYYDYDGNYVDEVLHIFIKGQDLDTEIQVYRTLVKLDYYKIYTKAVNYCDSTLYLLKDPISITINNIIDDYEIEDAYLGNTYGFEYSKRLSGEDNVWLLDYDIEKIFSLSDYELCDLDFYTIKNNLSNIEKIRLKKQLDDVLKVHDQSRFQELLDQIYDQNIIMIGFCSC